MADQTEQMVECNGALHRNRTDKMVPISEMAIGADGNMLRSCKKCKAYTHQAYLKQLAGETRPRKKKPVELKECHDCGEMVAKLYKYRGKMTCEKCMCPDLAPRTVDDMMDEHSFISCGLSFL